MGHLPGRLDATVWTLAASGIGLAATFGTVVWLEDLAERARMFVALFVGASILYGTAVARVIRHPPDRPAVLAGIFAAAVAFRLTLLPMTPTLSTDVYRYVWDGRLTLAGVGAYRHPPNAPAVAHLRDSEIYARLNRPDWRTIYPPGAQLLFAGVGWLAADSVLALKSVLTALDLVTIVLLASCLRVAGRPVAWTLIYAWHPLAVLEFAGHGHLDAAVITACTAAVWLAMRGHGAWAGVCAGAGTSLKLYPVLLLAALVRRPAWPTLAGAATVVAAGYGLHAAEGLGSLGSLTRFVVEEDFNRGLRPWLEALFAWLGPMAPSAARLVPLAALGFFTLALGVLGRDQPVWRRAFWLAAAYLVATPNLYPWYVLWIVPLLAFQPAWPWLYLSLAVGLTYLLLAQPVWHLPAWVKVAEFGPFLAGLLLAARPRQRPTPSPVPEAARS